MNNSLVIVIQSRLSKYILELGLLSEIFIGNSIKPTEQIHCYGLNSESLFLPGWNSYIENQVKSFYSIFIETFQIVIPFLPDY